jgi:hypothetical protein
VAEQQRRVGRGHEGWVRHDPRASSVADGLDQAARPDLDLRRRIERRAERRIAQRGRVDVRRDDASSLTTEEQGEQSAPGPEVEGAVDFASDDELGERLGCRRRPTDMLRPEFPFGIGNTQSGSRGTRNPHQGVS